MKRVRPAEVHFYEWSVSRWRTSSTRMLLDPCGRGIYRELLDAVYAQGSIPNPDASPLHLEAIARDCGATAEQFLEYWPIIKRHFIADKHDPTILRNKQADCMRNAYVSYIETQRENGKAGGRQKRGRATQEESIVCEAVAEPVLPEWLNQTKTKLREEEEVLLERVHSNQTNTSPKCISPDTESEPTKPAKPTTRTHQNGHSERDRWFMELFWPVVWAKIGKDAALKAWRVKIGTREQCDKAVTAAVAQGPAILERGARSGSVLHPATWLNGGRMDDEEPELPTVTRKRNGSEPAWVALAAQGKLPC